MTVYLKSIEKANDIGTTNFQIYLKAYYMLHFCLINLGKQVICSFRNWTLTVCLYIEIKKYINKKVELSLISEMFTFQPSCENLT